MPLLDALHVLSCLFSGMIAAFGSDSGPTHHYFCEVGRNPLVKWPKLAESIGAGFLDLLTWTLLEL